MTFTLPAPSAGYAGVTYRFIAVVTGQNLIIQGGTTGAGTFSVARCGDASFAVKIAPNGDVSGDGNAFDGGCGKGGQSPLPVSNGSPHIRIQQCLIGGR